MFGVVNAVILPEFEAFARQQVEAGAFASEQDALNAALRGYLEVFRELRASLQEAAAQADQGEGLDGASFMADMLARAKAHVDQHD